MKVISQKANLDTDQKRMVKRAEQIAKEIDEGTYEYGPNAAEFLENYLKFKGQNFS
jgi:hypothetical protein